MLVSDPLELEKIRQRESDITKERIEKILASGANVILTTKGIDDMSLKYFVEAGAIAARRVPKDDLRYSNHAPVLGSPVELLLLKTMVILQRDNLAVQANCEGDWRQHDLDTSRHGGQRDIRRLHARHSCRGAAPVSWRCCHLAAKNGLSKGVVLRQVDSGRGGGGGGLHWIQHQYLLDLSSVMFGTKVVIWADCME